VSYSELFAEDLSSLFIFKKGTRKVVARIKTYIESLVAWLYKWRLKMNAKKCCYTVFSRGKHGMRLDIRIKGDPIPYNSNPVFLGVTFDERLSFNTHYANLRARALKRLNIIKFFSHRSWRIDVNTLINIYRALIGSVFDYSFFTVTSTSDTSLSLVQRVQNRAIRCIFRLEWDSPTHE
jgi:hypothetical protein